MAAVAPSHGLRNADAFSLYDDHQWPPAGNGGREFLDTKKFKGTTQLKKKINPTRPIEKKESDNFKQSVERLRGPDRCIRVGDRESEIYKLYCLTQDLGTHFLVRTKTR